MSHEVWNEKSSQQSASEPPHQQVSPVPGALPCECGNSSSPGNKVVRWPLLGAPGDPSFCRSVQAAYPPPLLASHHHPPSHPHFVTPTAVSGCLCPHFSPVPSTSVRLYPEGRWGRRWCLCYSFTHMQVQG